MGFIRTNWSRLSLALLFLIGAVLAVVYYIVGDGFAGADFASILPFVSAVLFFLGMMLISIFKITGTKCAGITYAVVGLLVTILNLVAICVYPMGMTVESFWMIIVPLIVFGFYPLMKGITKFVESSAAPKAAPAPAKEAAK